MTDDIITVKQIAVRLGLHEGHVRRLAVQYDIGRKINNRMRVFTEADVARLQRARKPAGRPKARD